MNKKNILPVTVGGGEWHGPRCWEVLSNRRGSSNAAQRMAVLEGCPAGLGRERMGSVGEDREFVGHAWLKWRKDNGLNLVMRRPGYHLLTLTSGQRFALADYHF